MTAEEVIKYYCTIYGFKKQTGMDRNNVYQWKKQGYVPLDMQRKLEAITNGALKARFEDGKKI